jgi:hypothetical protein
MMVPTVGDSPGNEIAITVTGLKPNHFYNIRVVAMGPNNFQAASETIRLRTFGKDGKPYLGNARLPTSFIDDDHTRLRCADDSDGPDAPPSSFAAAVEAAPVLDGQSAATRDAVTSYPGQRRNTVNRRHSPSVASADQPTLKSAGSDGPEPSLDELNHKFQEIRREINDTLALISIEEKESLQIEDELKKEKEQKRQALKEKEEQTNVLKTHVRLTMEQMRASEKERSKKEQQLRDKENKKSKVRDSVVKLEKERERMKRERDWFISQKAALEENRDCDVNGLDDDIAKLQDELNELESDLSNKGKQLNEMKEARKHLAGADDDQFKESDERTRREWDYIRNTLHNQLVEETKISHQLDQHYHNLAEQISLQHQAGLAYFGPGESTVDLDLSRSNQAKRLSQNSNHLNDIRGSPSGPFRGSEPSSQLPPGLSRTGFAAGLFIPDSATEPQTEEDMRASAGPLSPSAHAYLPSGIIDFETSDSKQQSTPLLPESITAGVEDPQSPASSSRSFSVFSSPHGSSQNLPFPAYVDNGDRASLNLNSSPTAPPAAGLRLTSLLATFQRNRAAKISDEDGGPPIGTLRPGQSQSFPREADETDLGSRRRISFSFKNHRNSATGLEGGPGHPLASKMLSRHRLNPFASSATPVFNDRDPESSRPASIASSDLPRPSTDSGSIWGAPGDASSLAKRALWSSPNDRWPSRSGSRRPSLHGSPSLLTTSLASADDEILYETELKDPQTSASQVGIIGSRPPGVAKSISQRLNPNAPTFKGLFRKDKDKEKDRGKDRTAESKVKGKEVATPSIPSIEMPLASFDDSPSDSRMSRDTFSVHTQTSVSESHDSLPLEGSSSNLQLESSAGHASTNSKDLENVNSIRKLLRKGSSGKFSLSSRLGKDSSLFKKGPGSATNSDRNTSADHRSSIGDLEELGEDPSQYGRGYDSVTSSPSLGPAKSKESKESRMSNWRFMKKKGKETTPNKEKESLEMDRAMEEE